jgi:hypothetical protein
MPSVPAVAEPVTPQSAVSIVVNWLARNSRPLGARLGTQVAGVETNRDARGLPVYFVVNLRPGGFVIVSGDDLVEPIVAFVPAGRFDPSAGNPLGALVGADLPLRIAAARSGHGAIRSHGHETAMSDKKAAARAKWSRLLAQTTTEWRSPLGLSTLSDPRVDPLIASRWGQTSECGSACYNYYTPPGSEGSSSNYPAG